MSTSLVCRGCKDEESEDMDAVPMNNGPWEHKTSGREPKCAGAWHACRFHEMRSEGRAAPEESCARFRRGRRAADDQVCVHANRRRIALGRQRPVDAVHDQLGGEPADFLRLLPHCRQWRIE